MNSKVFPRNNRVFITAALRVQFFLLNPMILVVRLVHRLRTRRALIGSRIGYHERL
jgi:hypothetical protein